MDKDSLDSAEVAIHRDTMRAVNKLVCECRSLVREVDQAVGKHESGNGLSLLVTANNVLEVIGKSFESVEGLAQEFEAAMLRYIDAEVRTLDEAFEVTRPKKWNQDSVRFRRKKGHLLEERIWQLRESGLARTFEEAFHAAADEFNRSFDFVKQHFYMRRRALGPARARRIRARIKRFEESYRRGRLGNMSWDEYITSEHALDWEVKLYTRHQDCLHKYPADKREGGTSD